MTQAIATFGTAIPLAAAPPNVPPVATDDSVQVAGSQPVTIDLVSNDSDSDGVIVFNTIHDCHSTCQWYGDESGRRARQVYAQS